MPELPDVTIYVEAIQRHIAGQHLQRVRVLTPFVLRSVEPAISSFTGRQLLRASRMGKRIVFEFDEDLFFIIHLMISGRLSWGKPNSGGLRPGGKAGLAAFEFETGQLLLTEASTHKRATLYAVRGTASVEAHRPPGIEPLECSRDQFESVMIRENRTLKRALTNPAWFSGIGNAYSDEILHAARLSPLKLTHSLSSDEILRLYEATLGTLTFWVSKLRAEFGDKFPERGQITAFRPDFAVHGRFRKPCPVCGSPVQRIAYADHETNYCAKCQNEGRILADRSLSRLLKEDWPRTLEEMG